MAYADPKVQRKFQREWAARKRKSGPKPPSANLVARYEWARDLRKSTITKGELTQEDFSKIKTYEECIKKAAVFVYGRHMNRLAIAALAIRACEIKHGGDMRSKALLQIKKRDQTLTAFAIKICIHPHTVWAWVDVKRSVVDKLPPEIEIIDWTAANRAARDLKHTGLSAENAYYENLNPEPKMRGAILMCNYFRVALSQIKHTGLSEMPREKVEIAEVLLDEINEHFLAAQKKKADRSYRQSAHTKHKKGTSMIVEKQ